MCAEQGRHCATCGEKEAFSRLFAGAEKENGLTQTKELKLQEAQEQMRAVGECSVASACLQRHGKPVEDDHND